MTGEIHFEDLRVGQKASFGKTITESDIVLFAAVTGDTNPMHLNAEYAKDTIFGERIAHGMLAAGLITKVLGTQLPGPGTIYLSQSLKFREPVRIGQTVTETVGCHRPAPRTPPRDAPHALHRGGRAGAGGRSLRVGPRAPEAEPGRGLMRLGRAAPGRKG